MVIPKDQIVSYNCVTLKSLKKRSGVPFRDGSHVQHFFEEGTIDKVAKRKSGVFHRAQEKYSINYFVAHGYKVFPKHIGIEGINRWADFAVARYRRVILVECMTDWFYSSTIRRKTELASACELWFVAEPEGKKEIKRVGYHCTIMPSPRTKEWRDLKTKFWICRPKVSKWL